VKFGWLTPDLTQLSAPVICREIAVPGDLWQFVTGALLELTRSYNWEQHGTASPDESADYFKERLEVYLNSMCAYVGEIRSFALAAAPPGWLLLDGSAISASTYPDLAAAVPGSWVSSGVIFLPNMVGKALVGSGSNYDLGDLGGEENHTLTLAEIPSHNHSYELAIISTDILGELPAPSVNALSPSVTGSSGGGDEHNNMPPYLVVNWGIYTGVL